MASACEIEGIVRELLRKPREENYWDFKEKWHQNKAELLHDLLCLSNADHNGSRYLVLGVRDDDHYVVGIEESSNRKTQADLIDFLRSNAKIFAGRINPEIKLWTIFLNGKAVDVVEIFDRPFKPYRLIEPYRDGNKTCSVAIYTRRQDTNTPIDKSAEESDLEWMFRQRLGLNLRPYDRLKHMLSDQQTRWTTVESEVYFNEMAPEYSMHFSRDSAKIDDEWLRGEIGYHLEPGSLAINVEFRYFATTIAKHDYVVFDNTKKRLSRPDWAPVGHGRVYYYREGSLGLAFQEYLENSEGRSFRVGLTFEHSGEEFRLPTISRLQADHLWRVGRENTAPERKPSSDHAVQNEIFEREMKALLSSLD